jgi:aryl-alcohol dehydrogenase-like predicted oxidoreductase
MKYTLLGASGLRVSTVCLGTMGFLRDAAWVDNRKVTWCSSKEDSAEIVGNYLDEGGNIIDTANSYGASEDWLGEFLGQRRHDVLISTKYCGSISPADINATGSHRKCLIRSVERSLGRLKTDYIDILSVHCWDFLTPVDEVMRALDDLIRAGKVLYIGVSNAPAWVVAMANTDAQLRGRSRFSNIQVEYNLIERDVEREILPMARALEIGVMAWTPLASGWLTGKYLDDGAPQDGPASRPNGSRRLDDQMMGRFVSRNDRNTKIAGEVRRIASELARPPAQVALNWLRQNGVIPIVGARTGEQIRENLRCTEFVLDSQQMDDLTKAGKISLGYPHTFLNSPMVRRFVYGEHCASMLGNRDRQKLSQLTSEEVRR